MLITAGEEFTADRVIEKALRQDVGMDPSAAMNKENYQFRDEDTEDPRGPIFEYKKKYRDN